MTRVNRIILARHVSDNIPRLVVANMGRLPAHIPVQEKARPMMMVHGLCFSGKRHRDLQDADERILVQDSVTAGRRRDGVIALREIRLILRNAQGLPSAYGD